MVKRQQQQHTLTCGPYRFNLKKQTLLMGIINITHDSFSDGGRFLDPQSAYRQAKQLVKDGAALLDLGAESSRPGAKPISSQKELARLLPAFKLIKKLQVPISIDTYKPEVAETMLRAGAHMINDISGGRESAMLKVAATYQVPIVLMHMQGRPPTMQQAPRYCHVVTEVKQALQASIQAARRAGIKAKNIIIDPGIGFGKTMTHNLQLLNKLEQFQTLGAPLLIGASRKSFIGTIVQQPRPTERDWGTAATVALSVAAGVKIIRVHDVKHMAMVSKVAQAICQGSWKGSQR